MGFQIINTFGTYLHQTHLLLSADGTKDCLLETTRGWPRPQGIIILALKPSKEARTNCTYFFLSWGTDVECKRFSTEYLWNRCSYVVNARPAQSIHSQHRPTHELQGSRHSTLRETSTICSHFPTSVIKSAASLISPSHIFTNSFYVIRCISSKCFLSKNWYVYKVQTQNQLHKIKVTLKASGSIKSWTLSIHYVSRA